MKKWILWIGLFFLMTTNVQAESYCVMSGDEHEVVEEKDMHKTQSVASISKIMTAVLAIEKGNLTDRWAVSDAILKVDGSSLYLQVGQEVSLEDLLYGLMLRSGNDAAVEIATHISGDVESFVALMNEKAKQIGMLDTTFHNPSGLDEEDGGNLSSAYDMALLMSYAMKNPTFVSITGSQYYTSSLQQRWKNKNKLLFAYDKAIGGKTGFTKKAGRTLVSAASDGNTQSIVVTLKAGDDFTFHEQKHEQVFAQTKSYELLKAGHYVIAGYEVDVEEGIRLSIRQDGSDQLEVSSGIEDEKYVVHIVKNGQETSFTYPARKQKQSIGGWFS